jgi:hypothetical protein
MNTPVSGALSATDPEGQALTYSLATQGGKGSVNLDSAGNYSYTPNNPNFRGLDMFTYNVTDTEGNTSIGSVWVIIDGVIRVMPLGDSITQGIFTGGGCDADGSCPARSQRIGYRKKLWTDLEALSPNYAVDFVGGLADGSAAGLTSPDDRHEGHPGDCPGPTLGSWCTSPDLYDSSQTRNLSDNILTWLNANQADVILLHAGTNGLNLTSTTATADAVKSLLTQIDSWAQANYRVMVFVARIIPSVDGSLSVNTFNSRIDAILPTNYPHLQLFTVDQQSQLRSASDPNMANPTYMSDNLHPNQTGYDRMADKWKADLVQSGALPNCP